MADEELKIVEEGTPKGDKPSPGVIPSNILEAIKDAKDEIELLKRKVDFITTTNQLVVIVLFAFVAALVFSAINANNTGQSNLTNSINQLTNDINNLRGELHQMTPTPIPNK